MVHILVVEDDTQLNKIVCSYLNGSGFKAKGCTPAACPGIAAQSRDRGRAQIKGWEAHITYKLLSYPNKTFTREKQIEFEADVEERLLIRGDPSLLELVWTNLFSNAFKYIHLRRVTCRSGRFLRMKTL